MGKAKTISFLNLFFSVVYSRISAASEIFCQFVETSGLPMIVKPGRESSIRMNVDIFNQVAENRNYMCIHIKQFTLSQSNNLHLVNGICSICSIVWVAHFLQFFFFLTTSIYVRCGYCPMNG